MVTRLYLHNAVSGVTGTLPSTEQSTQTSALNFESQATNRSMDTTIGTAQVQLDFTNSATRSNVWGYMSKFVSPSLNQTSVAANTWRWNFAAQVNNTALDDYPTPGANNTVPVCCYVWRPSTGAKVANILDGNASDTYRDVAGFGQTTERSEDGTFIGSAVTCQVNDVIVFEAWCRVKSSVTTSAVISFMYDGTTVTLTNNTAVSNHASFIETPENLSFIAGGAPIDMTESAAKTYSNKFITKV